MKYRNTINVYFNFSVKRVLASGRDRNIANLYTTTNIFKYLVSTLQLYTAGACKVPNEFLENLFKINIVF